MKRRTAVTAALLALAGPGGAQSLARSRKAAAGSGVDASAFVSVEGARFARHGRPYYIAGTNHYLNVHVDHAKALGKPIVLEEFGLGRDGGSFDIRSPTTVRDRFYGEVFALVQRRAAAGDPIAGWNFWAWGGAGRAANPDYCWRPGNDFVGDPPQEEQGLYPVFDSDASTLRLIRESAQRLHALAPRLARQ